MLFFILCCGMSCEKEIIGPPTVVVNVVNNSDSTIYYNAFHCNVEKEEDYKMISHMVNKLFDINDFFLHYLFDIFAHKNTSV